MTTLAVSQHLRIYIPGLLIEGEHNGWHPGERGRGACIQMGWSPPPHPTHLGQNVTEWSPSLRLPKYQE